MKTPKASAASGPPCKYDPGAPFEHPRQEMTVTTEPVEVLKPCPFCGGRAVLRGESADDGGFYAACKELKCYAAVGEGYDRSAMPEHCFGSQEKAAEAWNHRALPKGEPVGKLLRAEDVEWVVNDIAELGVKIGGQFFFLYKGHSLVYDEATHDDGSTMHWRPVFKREFGECAHPINYKDPTKIGTVSLDDSDDWQVLPQAKSYAAEFAAPSVKDMGDRADAPEGWKDDPTGEEVAQGDDNLGLIGTVSPEVYDACERASRNIVNLFGGGTKAPPALELAIRAALLRAYAPPKSVRIAMSQAKEATSQ